LSEIILHSDLTFTQMHVASGHFKATFCVKVRKSFSCFCINW